MANRVQGNFRAQAEITIKRGRMRGEILSPYGPHAGTDWAGGTPGVFPVGGYIFSIIII